MKHLWLFLVLSLAFLLNAEEEQFDPFASSLTNTQNLLPTTIHSISAISGEWLESEADFIVKGAEPLVLTRSYSADYLSSKLGFNWDFSRPHPLVIKKTSSKTDKTKYSARLHHPAGVRTIHGKESEDPKQTVITLPISRTKGLTNCRSGEISGRTNLHNIKLHLDRENDVCEAITGSGHVIHYTLEGMKKGHFKPEYEIKPNGNLILFEKNHIKGTNSNESIVYGTISLKEIKTKTLEVKASDGQWANYTFNTYESQEPPHNDDPNWPYPQLYDPFSEHKYCLVKADYSHKPQIEYEYEHPPHKDPLQPPPNPLLKKKKLPNHRGQEVVYYQKGSNKVKDGHIELKKDDFRCHRIK